MTHRDGFPRLSARSAWRGDAGHRKPCAPSQGHGPSESFGKPPFRSGGRPGRRGPYSPSTMQALRWTAFLAKTSASWYSGER